MRIASLASALVLAVVAAPAPAEDWPQWLGPRRDSVWREQGVVARFPAQGLKVRWRSPLGLGYSGPAVAGDRVFVMDYEKRQGEVTNNPGRRDKLEGKERVLCFDAAMGKLLWKHEYDRPYHVSYGGGPRATTTVHDGKVYALGAEGNLWCLDAADGRVIWSKDFVKDYGAPTPLWGAAAHPLADGDALYCMVGGQGSAVVAFDRNTGRELWKALNAPDAGYCPPTMIEHAGQKQLLVWHPESIHGLDPRTGSVHWSVPLKPAAGMSITAPRKLGPYVLATGYGDVGVLLKLDDARPAAEVVWRGKPQTGIFTATSTPFLEDGTIYGCDISTGALMAVRLEDGQRLWQTVEPTLGKDRRGRYGTAFLVKHEDRFFLFNEQGDLLLARLSPKGYEELGRFHVLEATSSTFGRPVVWSHPAFARQCLFARNDKELVCVSLAAAD